LAVEGISIDLWERGDVFAVDRLDCDVGLRLVTKVFGPVFFKILGLTQPACGHGGYPQ
jgi:hypothetical protein